MIPVDVLDRYYPLQKPNTRNGTAVLKWKGLVKNACGYAYFSQKRIRETAREI